MFSGAFALLRKGTVGYVMRVPVFGLNNSAPIGRILSNSYILILFANLPGKSTFHENMTEIIIGT
jgi:hypothetical protein